MDERKLGHTTRPRARLLPPVVRGADADDRRRHRAVHGLARRSRRTARRAGHRCHRRARAGRTTRVRAKGLLWGSHPEATGFSKEQNRNLAEIVDAAGGEVLLDQRVRRAGCHHQKLFVILHPRTPERDVAFVGGIDLCHGRNDDEHHHGDPQAIEIDQRFGPTPAWHDMQVEIRVPRWATSRRPSPSVGVIPRRCGVAFQRSPRVADRRPAHQKRGAAWHSCRPGPSHVSGQAAAVSLRERGERSVARGIREGVGSGAPADLHRGPVPVVERHCAGFGTRARHANPSCAWSSSCLAIPTRTVADRPAQSHWSGDRDATLAASRRGSVRGVRPRR